VLCRVWPLLTGLVLLLLALDVKLIHLARAWVKQNVALGPFKFRDGLESYADIDSKKKGVELWPFSPGVRRLHRRLDRLPVGGRGTRLHRLAVPVSDVRPVLADDVAAHVAPIGLALVLEAVEVRELLHRVGGRHGLRLERRRRGGGRRRGHERRDGVDRRSGGSLPSLGGCHLLLARGLRLLAEGRARLLLGGLADRPRVRRSPLDLRLARRSHLRLLGRRPPLEGGEDVLVGPLIVGLLLLEEGAELLADGGGCLVVRVRALDEGADALRELDPDVRLLRLGVRVLHLLGLHALERRKGHALSAEGGLERRQLRLERRDGAEERLGCDDCGAHSVVSLTCCLSWSYV